MPYTITFFNFVIKINNVCLQTTGVDDSQAKAVSFLFSLLVKAVKKLSQPEKDSLVASEDQLCDSLELVVDKWLVEQVFLDDQWLAEAEHDSLSVEQKKRSRRKSRESSQMLTSVDYLCSSETVQLLHLAVESCSKFQLSPVVRLAVMKMFGGSKILLEKAQHNGILGRAYIYACTIMFRASAHTWVSTQSTFQNLNAAAYPMWAKIAIYSALTLDTT